MKTKKIKKQKIGWVTHFNLYAFSPDGPFYPQELENYLNEGVRQLLHTKGIGFRMSPFKVTPNVSEK